MNETDKETPPPTDNRPFERNLAPEADQFRLMLDNARNLSALRDQLRESTKPSRDDMIVGGLNLNGPFKLHDVQLEGQPADNGRRGAPLERPSPDEIKYPNGEKAKFTRNGSEINRIVFYDKDGKEESHYVKRGNDWYSQTRDGMKAKLDGRIDVSPTGNVSMEVEPNTWRTRKTDGTIQMERQNKDGSRVGYDSEGRPNKITRPDKSVVEADYQNGQVSGIREFNANGSLSQSWTKKGDHYESTQAPGENRKNFQLGENGEFKFDRSIVYPGGEKVRDISRDADGKVNKIVTKDADGKVTLERQGNEWSMRMGSMPPIKYPGQVQVSANNDVSFEVKPGIWQTEKADGSVRTERANRDGSRVATTKDGQVQSITRADGTVVEGTYKEGKLSEVTEYGADGRKTTWKDQGDHWEGSNGQQRKNLQMFNTGLTLWEGKDGTKHGVMGDGRTLRERPGEAQFSFDKKGQIDSITYPDGEKLKFTRFDSGAIKGIEQYKNDKLFRTQTRDSEGSSKWAVTAPNGKNKTDWNGQYEVTATGDVRFKEEGARNKDGLWSIARPDGKNYKEQLLPEGGRKIINNDKSFAEIDANGLVRKTGTSKDNYRTFEYDNGQLSKVTDYRKGKQPSTTDYASDQSRKEVKVNEFGDITYRTTDGKAVMEKANLSKVEIDKDGYLQKVTQPDGSTREFNYKTSGTKKELDAIIDSRTNEKGEVRTEKWQREAASNNFVKEGDPKSIRKDVEVFQNGDYQYKSTDDKTRVAKAGRDRGENGMSASVDEARDRLLESIEPHMDQARRQRMEAFMKQFEKRAQSRIEDQVAAGMDRSKVEEDWQRKVAGTYDHLSAMTKTDLPNAPYDLQTRVKLVENSMLFAMEPTKNNQGGHGTCWIEGPINLIGWTNNPDKMARLVSQVSTTGTFTTVEGPNNGGGPKTYTIPKQQLNFDAEARGWTVDGNDKTFWKGGGYGTIPRSPVGQICDHTLSYIGGRSDGGTHGGTWESFHTTGNRWYYGSQELLRMATGDTAKLVRIQSNNISDWDARRLTSGDLKDEMLKRGGVVLVGPGHIFTAKLVHNNGERAIVADNQWGPSNDQKIGVVKDVSSWNVQRVRERYKPDWPTGIPKIQDDNEPSHNRPHSRQLPQYYDPSPVPYYQPYRPMPQPIFIRRWRYR